MRQNIRNDFINAIGKQGVTGYKAAYSKGDSVFVTAEYSMNTLKMVMQGIEQSKQGYQFIEIIKC